MLGAIGDQNWHGHDEDVISSIFQDDGSCDTRTRGQHVWEQGCPRMMTGRMITSSKLEK